MKIPRKAGVSSEAFLAWVFDREGRFELVDGAVVERMAGAKQGHDVAVSNIVACLAPQAKNGGCQTTSSDTAVQTGANGIRFPDVVVDCGPPDPSAIAAGNPVLVAEVSSPGTSQVDTTDKLDEYQRHETVRLILFVEPAVVSVKLYRRDGQGAWKAEKYEDLPETIAFPEIGAFLSLREVYDTIQPR